MARLCLRRKTHHVLHLCRSLPGNRTAADGAGRVKAGPVQPYCAPGILVGEHPGLADNRCKGLQESLDRAGPRGFLRYFSQGAESGGAYGTIRALFSARPTPHRGANHTGPERSWHNSPWKRTRSSSCLLEGVHPSAVETLEQAGYSNIETHHKKALPAAELKAGDRRRSLRGHPLAHPADRGGLRGGAKLVAVGCFCIGTNQVDLQAATRRGIAVFNAPFSNTRSVAELVIAEAILLLRGVAEKNAAAHRGEWQKIRRQRLRNSRQEARHHRLRQYRHAARA